VVAESGYHIFGKIVFSVAIANQFVKGLFVGFGA
jgi:hypothetical protein